MANIKGVAEIVLNARDIDRMREFYEQVLGFGFHSQHPESNPTIIFLSIGPTHTDLHPTHPQMLALIDPDRHPAARGKFDPPTNRAFPLNHLAFEIEETEYNSHLEELQRAGLKPVEATFKHARAKAMFFSDPEGNRLELICHDSSVSHEDMLLGIQETNESIQDAIDEHESEHA